MHLYVPDNVAAFTSGSGYWIVRRLKPTNFGNIGTHREGHFHKSSKKHHYVKTQIT